MTKNAADRLSNDEKVKAIDYWQDEAYVHPLTCGNNSQEHAELRGREVHIEFRDENGNEDGTMAVELFCPTCDYTQEYVPEHVYSLYEDREEYEKAFAAFGFKKNAGNNPLQEGTFLKEDQFNNENKVDSEKNRSEGHPIFPVFGPDEIEDGEDRF